MKGGADAPLDYLSDITAILLHKELILPIQVVIDMIQLFPEPLEAYASSFLQGTQGS